MIIDISFPYLNWLELTSLTIVHSNNKESHLIKGFIFNLPLHYFFNKFASTNVPVFQEKYDVTGLTKYNFLLKHLSFTHNEKYW